MSQDIQQRNQVPPKSVRDADAKSQCFVSVYKRLTHQRLCATIAVNINQSARASAENTDTGLTHLAGVSSKAGWQNSTTAIPNRPMVDTFCYVLPAATCFQPAGWPFSLAITSQEVPMSTQFKAPVGLVPIEGRWHQALAALFRRIRLGTGFRKHTASREAHR